MTLTLDVGTTAKVILLAYLAVSITVQVCGLALKIRHTRRKARSSSPGS